MKSFLKGIIALALLGFTTAPAMASGDIDGAKLFSKKCKMCHAISKKRTGPALISMNKDEEVLRNVITNGSSKKRLMKAYGKKLSSEQIDALVAYIKAVQ